MKKGISLILLIITIIIIIIIAGTLILTLSNNQTIGNASKAVFLSDVDTIKSEIHLYTSSKFIDGNIGHSLYPIVLDSDSKPVHPNYSEIDTSSKVLIAEAQNKYLENGMTDVFNIDLQKVYIIDSNKIKSSRKYGGNILLVEITDLQYKLIFKKGVEVVDRFVYSLDNMEFEETGEPQFFAIGNNTFKLTASGYLSALGEKNSISGATKEELDFLNIQWKQFNPNSIIPNMSSYTLSYGTAYLINNSGELYAVGDNTDNKLGLGNSYIQHEPVQIVLPEPAKVKAVYGGPRNTWIVDEYNNVWAAGSNTQGEMGLDNKIDYTTYQKITSIDGSLVKNIIVSDNYYCRFTMVEYSNGQIYVAGSNDYGTWGVGNTSNSLIFKEITVEWKKNAQIAFPIKKMIAGNLLVTGILDSNDTLWVCGYNDKGRLGNGNQYNQPSFIKFSDNVKDFDIQGFIIMENKSGQIFKTPKVVFNEETKLDEYFSEKLEVLNVPAGGYDLVRDYYVFDKEQNKNITKSGAIVSGGKIYYIEDKKSESEPPIFVEDTNAPKNIVSMSLKRGMLTAVDNTGKIYLYNNNIITAKGSIIQKDLRTIKYGENIFYITGFGNTIHVLDAEYRLWTDLKTTTPKQNVIKSVVTRSNQYMLLNNGELYSKGYSEAASYGAGGWGTNDAKEDFVLIQQNVKDIFGCDGGAISIANDNKVYAWGQVWSQFLNLPGYTKTGTLKTPTLLTGSIENMDIKTIYLLSSNYGTPQTATYIHTTDDSIYAYGVYGYTGLSESATDYQKVELPGKVKKIKTNLMYTLCLLENGDVYAWGTNTSGQFGNGYNKLENYPTPQKLNIDNVVEIAAGNGFSLFIKSNKEVYGSGRNEFGQLGNGNNISTNEFVRCVSLEK